MTKELKEKILSRMYNWKMRSAYELAINSKEEISQNLITLLKTMSDRFSNCGWQEGTIFNELRDTNNIIADLLGYVWNDDLDKWIEKD